MSDQSPSPESTVLESLIGGKTEQDQIPNTFPTDLEEVIYYYEVRSSPSSAF
jgi:hypothetical protein